MARVPRAHAEMFSALENHVALLEEYATRAFSGEAALLGDVAGKLRLLVCESGKNKALLLRLADLEDDPLVFTLGGPPVTPPPGVPGPGDEVTLRQYMSMLAVAVRVPSTEKLEQLTNTQFVAMWAQQAGAAHEDWSLDERFAMQRHSGLSILGAPPEVHALAAVTRTVLHCAKRFISKPR